MMNKMLSGTAMPMPIATEFLDFKCFIVLFWLFPWIIKLGCWVTVTVPMATEVTLPATLLKLSIVDGASLEFINSEGPRIVCRFP